MTGTGEGDSRWRWTLVVNGLVVAEADFGGHLVAPVKPVYLRLEPVSSGRFELEDHIVLKVSEMRDGE